MTRAAGELGSALFADVLAPLVLGGPLRLREAASKDARMLDDHVTHDGLDLASRCELARVRVARALAPIDTLPRHPTESEWKLAAVLHDVLLATHPGYDSAFRRGTPRKLLDSASDLLETIALPSTVGDALGRHAWFSRTLSVTRTDVVVRWWSGSARYFGRHAPVRITAWRGLRKVEESSSLRTLNELPTNLVDRERYTEIFARFLDRTPLTSFASITRSSPAFSFTRGTLELISTRAGRTAALRALEASPAREVDAALGRATRVWFGEHSMAASLVVALLCERTLKRVLAREAFDVIDEDASFANQLGGVAATVWLGRHGHTLAPNEAKHAASTLESTFDAGPSRAVRPWIEQVFSDS